MTTKKDSFEEQLNELQEIVNKPKSGSVPLEDTLNEFQAGVKLSRELEKKLNDTKQTVARLVDKDGNGKALSPQNTSAPEEE